MQKNILKLPDGTKITSGVDDISIMALEHYETVNSGSELRIGSACTSYITATIHTPGSNFTIPYGTEIEYWVDRDGIETKIGLFTTEQPERASRNTLKIKAYDRMTWFDVDITDWIMATDFTGLRLLNLLQLLCNLLQINLVNTSIINGNFVLSNFNVEITARKLLEYIAEISGSFARITANGALELSWYSNRYSEPYKIVPTAEDGEQTRCAYFQNSLFYEGYAVKKIEKVLIINDEDDVGVSYPSVVGNTYTIKGNPLLPLDNPQVRNIAYEIFNRIKTLSYTPAKVSIPNSFNVRAGDFVEIEDANGNKVNSIVMSCRRKGGRMTVQSAGSENRASTANMNRFEYKDIANRLFQASVSVDGLKMTAKDQGSKIAELSQTVDGFKFAVKDKDGETTLVLESGAAELASLAISLLGVVTFANLSKDGETVINGGNITTGRISSQNGESYIDLDTGIANLTGSLKTILESFVAENISYFYSSHVSPSEVKTEILDSDGNTTCFSKMDPGRFRTETKDGLVEITTASGHWKGPYSELAIVHNGLGEILARLVPEQYISGEEDPSPIAFITINNFSDDNFDALSLFAQSGRRCVTGLTAPVNDSDAVNKAYVDNLVAQLRGG